MAIGPSCSTRTSTSPAIGREYKQEHDLLRAKVHTQAAPMRERLAYVFADTPTTRRR